MPGLKHSIANKLTIRISILLIFGYILVFGCAYFSVSRIVNMNTQRYARAIISIYGDLIAYESQKRHVPLDLNYSQEANFFGDYMCQFYRIDYIFMYMPNETMDSITYISFAKKESKFGDEALNHLTGFQRAYTLTPKEMEAWEESGHYCIGKSNEIERALEIEFAMTDTFGNKVMIGGGISLGDMDTIIRQEFTKVAVIILAVFGLITALLYLVIRRKVSRPARHISQIMTDYISHGKRSEQKLHENGKDEFAMIGKAFNKMSGDIDRYLEDIRSLNREQERQNAEIDVASSIQMGLLPPTEAKLGNCEIHAMLKPAKSIGGDLYDYQRIDDTHTLIVVGDVSGKGIPAAMFMTAVLVLIRFYSNLGKNPAELLRNTNDALVKRNPNMLFATAFVAIYDSEKEMLTYANAGHNPPFLIQGGPKLLEGAKNTLLGLFEDEEFVEESISMSPGDSILLYTDGVNEAADEEGVFFGMERFAQALKNCQDGKDLISTLQASLNGFVGKAEQSDDVTLLSMTARTPSPRQSHILSLEPKLEELSKIRNLILSSNLPRKMQLELCVATEEIFVNICSYAFEGKDKQQEKIEFFLDIFDKVTIRFTDHGIPYNPKENMVDLNSYDIDTQVGGLGRLIAFNVADETTYEYKEGKNILTVIKSLY